MLDFRSYRDASKLYFENGLKFTQEPKRLNKASELLWGAAVKAVKAIAALRQIKLTTHYETTSFVQEFAKETKRSDIKSTFVFAETLHKNFYDDLISPYDFDNYVKQVDLFLKKIAEFYPSEDQLKLSKTIM